MFVTWLNGLTNRGLAIIIVLCVSLLYVSYTFNNYLLDSLTRTFEKSELRNLFFSPDAAVAFIRSTSDLQQPHHQSPYNSNITSAIFFEQHPLKNDSQLSYSSNSNQTFLNILPLNLNLPSAGSNITDGSPKYRFLRLQGLRPSRHLPHALIIGVKKGGTRALLEFIRLHPDVRAAGSEVHFFDRHYKKGLRWYRHNMPYSIEGQITIEKTPSYFVTKDVPQRVHKMNPDTKLIIVVRDPVTRAISDYTQAASKKLEMKSFEELAFKNTSKSIVDSNWGPLKIGLYSKYLEKWLKHFPLPQLLFISGERLIVDPAYEVGRVQDFLGLKRVVTEKHFYFNATKGFPCLFKSEAKSTPHCLGKTKGRNHPIIDEAAIERLRDFYRPFNLKFYQLTGINFAWP